MSILFLASIVLGVGALRLSSSLAPWGSLTRWTSFLVLWAAGVNGTCLVAGLVMQSLSPGFLLGVAGAVGGSAALSGRYLSRQRSLTDVERVGEPLEPRDRLAVLAAIGLGVVALAYGWRIYHAWRFPILDWDGLSYHLVTVDVWLQHDAIVDVPHVAWSDGYPANGELMTLWLMAFTRNDSLADMTSVAYIPLLLLGTALLAEALGADRWTALIGGVLGALCPAALVLGSTSYVDVPAAAASVAGLGLIIMALGSVRGEGADSGSRCPASTLLWATTGISLGIAAGTKATAAALSLLTLLFAAVLVVTRRTLGHERRRARRGLVVAFIAVVVFGGYWYLDNLADHGNPAYPIALGPLPGLRTRESLGAVQMPEYFRNLSTPRKVLDSWVADFRAETMNYDVRPGGFGWTWPFILLPSLVLLLIWLAASGRLAHACLAALPLIAMVLNPMPWWSRLNLPVYSLGAAAFAVMISRLRAGGRIEERSPREARAAPGERVAIGVLVLTLIVAAANAWSVTRNSNHIGRVGHDPNRVLTLGEIASMSRRTSEELISMVSPWRSCRLDVIPDGALVATDGRVVHHHVIVGPQLNRQLLPPIVTASSPSDLEQRVGLQGVQYLVVASGGPIDRLAQQSPATLLPVADGVCGEKFPALRIYAVRR